MSYLCHIKITGSFLTLPGSCQFPTLGFVVDRYLRVVKFKPEKFWYIKLVHRREGVSVNFNWQRVHLFDRAAVTVMLERCLTARNARVTKVNEKPTSKRKPLPLTTVDLQMMGSRYLRMDSQRIMKVRTVSFEHGEHRLLTGPRSRRTSTPMALLATHERKRISLIRQLI